MERRALKAGAGVAMIVALSIAVMLTSCASSPNTTNRADNSGDAVFVYRDAYPGHAGTVVLDYLSAYEFDVVPL